MNIEQLRTLYAAQPQTHALVKLLCGKDTNHVYLKGLVASAAPMFFAGLAEHEPTTMVFVLNDADEAGYFYNDLKTLLADTESTEEQSTILPEVLFFPTSYRRSVKYGQRDAGNEILRTETLARLSAVGGSKKHPLYIVTEPSALSELVVSKKQLDARTLTLAVGQTIDILDVAKSLRQFGFTEVDYVYEPGQFAVRGSIVDVYSFSSENAFRIDFFGDEIDTIRTFEIESQLSQDKRNEVEIVPELHDLTEEKMPFLQFLPPRRCLR